MPGFASYTARDSTALNQPPAASTMKKQVITMIPENSRNITVSVKMTPREPEYSVNSV